MELQPDAVSSKASHYSPSHPPPRPFRSALPRQVRRMALLSSAATGAFFAAASSRQFPSTAATRVDYASFRRGIFLGGRSLPLSPSLRCSAHEEMSVTRPTAAEDGGAKGVRLVAVVGCESVSPLKGAPWEEVMVHVAEKLKWVDEAYDMAVFSDKSLRRNDERNEVLVEELARADLLVIVAVFRTESVDWLKRNSTLVPNIFCFDSSPDLGNKLGGRFLDTEPKGSFFSNVLGAARGMNRTAAAAEEVVKTVSDAWERHNSDDVKFSLLVIINAYVKPVPVLKGLRAKGFSTLSCMAKNCAAEVLNCLLDPNCRKVLQCLDRCAPADQVCNYRCIASYESPQLEAFYRCILHKHNCLELDAEIPERPHVPPMSTFQSAHLTHEVAEDLLVGWLGTLEWSWRVVAGQNPANDQFPCQYQLFYRGEASDSFWYEPVFQVRTLDGRTVWRRKKYKVTRAKVPGTFLSELDDGVVAKEVWTVVDVADDLSWGLFQYRGAAKAAGQSYTGVVLVSPDGNWPQDGGGRKLESALEKCRIKSWELYGVDNCSCGCAPLGICEGFSPPEGPYTQGNGSTGGL